MKLSNEDRAILAHVVPDPDVWVAHALTKVGEKAVMLKIDKWRPDYLAAKNEPNYMTRAQRDAYKSPEQIAEESARQAAALVAAAKAQSITDNPPSWQAVSDAIDAATTLAACKVIIKKLARVVYWLAKNQER